MLWPTQLQNTYKILLHMPISGYTSIPKAIHQKFSQCSKSNNTKRFDQRWKILLFTFFFNINYEMTLYLSPYLKPSVYSYNRLLCIKLRYSEYSFSYTMLQYFYWDLGNGKVIADSVISNCNSYSFYIHKIFSILNVLLICVNDRKYVRKNVHRGCTSEQIL